MGAPTIPAELVYLGDAVEVDADTYTWQWAVRDKAVVAANVEGKKLFIFYRLNPLKNPSNGDNLFERFNRRKAAAADVIDVPAPQKRVGRVNHIVYRSNKTGSKKSYIHQFEKHPIVWSDNPDKPKILVLTGGKIKVTKRGIEG